MLIIWFGHVWQGTHSFRSKSKKENKNLFEKVKLTTKTKV